MADVISASPRRKLAYPGMLGLLKYMICPEMAYLPPAYLPVPNAALRGGVCVFSFPWKIGSGSSVDRTPIW